MTKQTNTTELVARNVFEEALRDFNIAHAAVELAAAEQNDAADGFDEDSPRAALFEAACDFEMKRLEQLLTIRAPDVQAARDKLAAVLSLSSQPNDPALREIIADLDYLTRSADAPTGEATNTTV